jgi:hypothetical protein
MYPSKSDFKVARTGGTELFYRKCGYPAYRAAGFHSRRPGLRVPRQAPPVRAAIEDALNTLFENCPRAETPFVLAKPSPELSSEVAPN